MVFVQEDNPVKEDATMSKLDKDRVVFLNQFADCFSNSLPSELPPERPEDHGIDIVLGNSPPIKLPYGVSVAQQEEIMSQVQELLERELIQPRVSPHCFPVLLVHKKDGSRRMCIDYDALNKINHFLIPRIYDILDRLKEGAKFIHIDLKSGYHQVQKMCARQPFIFLLGCMSF